VLDLLRALEETWTGIDVLLASLEDEQWALPTPNTEWDIKDLAAHLGGLESMFLGFPQPEPPEGWSTGHTGLHQATSLGVAARKPWSTAQVLDELRSASRAQLDRLQGLDDAGWQEPTMGPLGMTSVTNFADIRLSDLFVHLLDLRFALGLPLHSPAEELAESLVVARVVRLTGWGAVKGAGLPDGTWILLEVTGPGGTTADLVVTDRRGTLVDPEPGATSQISGPGLAYVLEVSGRHEMARAAGVLEVEGEAAKALLAGYRLFG
jgi:uncharacterized protein (TIGR03083 family)